MNIPLSVTNSSFITCISNTDISEAQPAGFDQTECDFKDSMINSFRFQEKSFSDDLKCYENLICEITEERVMEINRSPEISEDSKLIHARLMDNLKDFQLQNEKFKSTVEILNKQKQEKEEEEEINQLRVDFNKEISRNKKLEKRLNAIERDYAQEKHFKEQLSQNQVNLKHDLEVKNAVRKCVFMIIYNVDFYKFFSFVGNTRIEESNHGLDDTS
ncbi:unnamed protein product [Rotaria sp. Silwood2]|nr:unnamed protein product [Rotaria sp. Silwood2]